ncbi:hypothetical protein GH733_000997, partial [Mirounga leonina]
MSLARTTRLSFREVIPYSFKTLSKNQGSCWVCFATDEDDRTAEWIGGSLEAEAGPVVYVLDLADRLISKACPFAAAGIMVGSIYWTAVTYGAVTVMQVVGHKEGLDVMERADPLFLLIGLPTIPVMLILGKMIRWEDYVLRLWRKYSNKLQILNSIFPGIGCPVPRIPAEANPLADHVSATRILCGALVFPTIATIVGKLMFSSVNSNLQRTILGGIAFVAIKGAFKVYFKQQQYL